MTVLADLFRTVSQFSRGDLMRWILLAVLLLCCVTGCDVKDAANFKVDLSAMTWQTVAIGVLLYLANSRGHFSAAAAGVLKFLRLFNIGPDPASKEFKTAAEVEKLLAEVFIQLKGHPEKQAALLKMMTPEITLAANNIRPMVPPSQNLQPAGV